MKITRFKNIHDIKDDWESLYAANTQLTPFQSYEWNLALALKLKACSLSLVNKAKEAWEPIYYKFEFNQEIIIVPMIVSNKSRNRKAAIFGQQDMSDYLSFIFAGNANVENIISAIEYLKNEYNGYTLILDRINESNILMLEALRRLKTEDEKKICVKIPVVPDLLSTIKSDSRRYVKQGYKRLEEDLLTFKFNISEQEISDSLCKELHEHYLHRTYNKFNFSSLHKAKAWGLSQFYKLFGSNNTLSYFCKIQKKDLFLFRSYIGDNLAAYMIGIERHNTMFILRISIADDLSSYRPGVLLIMESIRELHDKNKQVEFVDFSRGDESYKLNYGGVIHYNYLFTFN